MKTRNILVVFLVTVVTGIVVRYVFLKKTEEPDEHKDKCSNSDNKSKLTITLSDKNGNVIRSDSHDIPGNAGDLETTYPLSSLKAGETYILHEKIKELSGNEEKKIEFLDADSDNHITEESSEFSEPEFTPDGLKFPDDPEPVQDDTDSESTDNTSEINTDLNEDNEKPVTDSKAETEEATVEEITDSEEDRKSLFNTNVTEGLSEDIVRIMLDEGNTETGSFNFNFTEDTYLAYTAHKLVCSPDFPFKDCKIRFTSDVFFSLQGDEKRIVFIVKVEKDQKLSYNYLVCKVENSRIRIDTENAFRLIAGFPSLSHVTTTRAELTKGQKEQVKKTLNVLADSYCTGSFTESDKIMYLSILKDLKPRKSFAMQKVYRYFYKKF